ncbi:MAG: SH3 domain-containing protein [Actinobacteria bacterium]|nr:SH3 domain-containing protein [Actinomycetota bacterium]
MVVGQARRSAGTTRGHTDEQPEAKHALSSAASVLKRPRVWTTTLAAAAAAVCAGLVLSASAPFGQSVTAAPVAGTPSATREVETLSRGDIDREALAEAASASPSAADGADATADASPTASAAGGIYFVLATANVRDQPSLTANVVATLAPGAQVKASAGATNGWEPVTAGSVSGYVKSSLLGTTAPTPAAKATAATSSARPTSASGSYPACASGSAVESGLVPNAILVHRAVCTTFPDITTYGGIRGDGSEHASGQALDVMTSGARGQQIVAWLQANSSKLGIVELIYQQQIWTTQRASEGWRAMPDRGSITANHYDHIHVLVS